MKNEVEIEIEVEVEVEVEVEFENINQKKPVTNSCNGFYKSGIFQHFGIIFSHPSAGGQLLQYNFSTKKKKTHKPKKETAQF